MAAPVRSVFHAAVEKVLGSWTVLQLAVQHGFGGRDSQTKAEWMPEAINQWFSENDKIDPDEVEDFLTDVLDHEFNTVADDGSLTEIARKICGYWRLCSSGQEASVLQEIQTLPKPDVSGSQAQPAADDDDDDDDDDEDPHNVAPIQAANHAHTPNMAASDDREETPMEEDDGWTMVRKTKKK